MGVLACHVGCPVAAFDRPGWGLTSRPSRTDWEGKQLPNPYKLETQVRFNTLLEVIWLFTRDVLLWQERLMGVIYHSSICRETYNQFFQNGLSLINI